MYSFDPEIKTRDDMHDYQDNIAVPFLKNNPFSALFIDLGMGKTVISLTLIVDLIVESNFDTGPTLIIGPTKVVNRTWPDEIAEWRHLRALNFNFVRNDEVISAMDRASKAAGSAFEMSNPKPDGGFRTATERHFALKNWQAEKRLHTDDARIKAARVKVREQFHSKDYYLHLVSKDHVEWLVEIWGKHWPYKTVIIDESTGFKDHKTGRFKALKRVRPLITRLHQLTATPMAEGYQYLFAQMYLLDRGQRLGLSHTDFMSRFFHVNQYSRQVTLRQGADDEITSLISDVCLIMRAKDYLGQKEPVTLIDKVRLTDVEMDLYRKMEREHVISIGDEEVEAETAAALSQKLLQMASGVVYNTKLVEDIGGIVVRDRKVIHIHDHKLEKLHEICEEAVGENILVAYWHDSSLPRLQKYFPKSVVMDKAGSRVKDWNAGKIPMLLMHPMSGGHGLNLQKGGRRIVFFDIPWSLELYQQFVGRLHRQGQKDTVFVHHLVASGTIDELVSEASKEKKNVQEMFFEKLKRLIAESRRESKLSRKLKEGSNGGN